MRLLRREGRAQQIFSGYLQGIPVPVSVITMQTYAPRFRLGIHARVRFIQRSVLGRYGKSLQRAWHPAH